MLLTVTDGMCRWLWRATAVLAAVGAALPLLYLTMFAPAGIAERAIGAALFTVLAALVVLPAAAAVAQFVSQRLELGDDGVLHYRRGGRRLASAPLAQCWSDGTRLLIDGRAVPLRRGWPVFDPGRVDELLAGLPPSQRLAPTAFAWLWWRTALRRRRAAVAALVVGLAALAGLASLPPHLWREGAKWLARQAGLL